MRAADIARLGCGGMLTEFSPDSFDTQITLNTADEFLVSWIAWDYKASARGGGDAVCVRDVPASSPFLESPAMVALRTTPTAV